MCAELRTPLPRVAADQDGGGTRFIRRPALAVDEREEALVASVVVAAKRGDRDALRWLYLRYKDHVFGYVRSIVGDDHEAEDVSQQVFAKLLLVIGRYEARPGSTFGSWLLRLSRNAAIDHLRRRRDLVGSDVVERSAGVSEDSRGLHEALDILPREQREVLVMRHVVGLSPGEIADHLGKTESSIHGLHHRGRAALRRELVRMGAAPSCRTPVGEAA